MVDDLRISGPVPRGWVVLPLDPTVEPDAWARQGIEQAAAGLEPLETSIGVEAAAAQLAHAVREARGRAELGLAGYVGLVFMPDPIGPILAAAQVAVSAFETDPLRLEQLQAQSVHGEDVVGQEPEVGRLEGAAGTLARTRRIRRDGDDLVEGVRYVGLLDDERGYLQVDVDWTDLRLGDAMPGVADELAVGVEVHPA